MLKPKKGISKREIKQDKLVTTYFNSRKWIEQNRRLVSYVASTVAVLIAVWWFVDNNRRQSNERATTDLAKVYQIYDQGQFQLAIDGIPQENIRGLQSIVDEYGSTPSGEMAKLYLANSYFNTGNNEKALKAYNDVDVKDKLLSSAALAGAASCYEALGNHEEAGVLFEKAASRYMTGLQGPDNLFKSASNYSAAGKKAKAMEVLRNLKKEFPTSAYARDIERYYVEFGTLG
jgi:tetratricopeptide (TPR) repeat protein